MYFRHPTLCAKTQSLHLQQKILWPSLSWVEGPLYLDVDNDFVLTLYSLALDLLRRV